jgi:hypothetical protein
MSDSFLKQVEWVERLPGNGGDWGKGIVGMVRHIEPEIDALTEKRAKLDADIKQRTTLLRETVKRADKEVSMLFSNTQIEKAKNPPPDPMAG